jgi:trehalose 6-phosphate phosphatase
LAGSPAVDVAVISGRALDDIRSRVGLAGIKYVGNHGFELHDAGETWIHPEIERYRPLLDRARERIERELEPIPGCFLEDKHATLTVHHRQAGREGGSLAIATVQAVVDDEAELSMVVDEQAVEVRPDIDHHKGDAVEELFDAEPDTLVIYLGDAQTDVDAFRTLAAWDDETVHVSVGDALPASGHHLESPADVERFLRWLRIELGDLKA